MPYLIRTQDKPQHAEVRARLETEHRSYLNSKKQHLLAAGALLEDDGGEQGGGVYIIDAEDRATAEKFIANDPFSRAELFASVEIHRWRQAFFNFENTLAQAAQTRQADSVSEELHA